MIEKKNSFYNKLELAMELGICVRTLDKLMSDGQISFLKIRNRVIFSQEDLDAYVDDDEDMVCYLAPRFPRIHFYLYPYKTANCSNYKNVTTTMDLKMIF